MLFLFLKFSEILVILKQKYFMRLRVLLYILRFLELAVIL